MATRPCLDCGTLTAGNNRCGPCRGQRNRQRDKARGTANDRGYTAKWRGVSRPVWQGQACHYCGGRAQGADHVTPKSRGGTDEPSNLVPACTSCNSSKGGR